MRTILSLFLLALPMVELILLIAMGSAIGLLATLAWIIVTGLVGAWVLRFRGPRAFDTTMRQAASQGYVVSGHSALDILALGLAGFLLVVPGPVTDFMGLLLLITPLRRRMLAAWLGRVILTASVRRYGQGVIIEGESVREDSSDDYRRLR